MECLAIARRLGQAQVRRAPELAAAFGLSRGSVFAPRAARSGNFIGAPQCFQRFATPFSSALAKARFGSLRVYITLLICYIVIEAQRSAERIGGLDDVRAAARPFPGRVENEALGDERFGGERAAGGEIVGERRLTDAAQPG